MTQPNVEEFDEDQLLSLKVIGDEAPLDPPPQPSSARKTQPSSARRDNSKPFWSMSRGRHRGGDNPHLNRLHPIEMDEVLAQTQIRAPPSMATLELQDFKPRALPRPEQSKEHMEGDKFKDRSTPEFTRLRERLWRDTETPPQLRCYPEKFYYVQVRQVVCAVSNHLSPFYSRTSNASTTPCPY